MYMCLLARKFTRKQFDVKQNWWNNLGYNAILDAILNENCSLFGGGTFDL